MRALGSLRREVASSAVCALLLVFQPVWFFRRVLINPRAHIPFDIEGFHFPLIAYIAQCIRDGIAPLWDPYSYGGTPIHADVQAQLFYPFTWLAILAGNHTGGRNLLYWVEWLVPFHMMLAGVFTFALLRRMGLGRPAAFMGASVFQLGGFFASQAQHLCAVCTAAWMPLAALAVLNLKDCMRPRWAVVLALAVALSILSGFPATTIIVGLATWMFVAGLLLLRQTSWRIVVRVAFAFVAGAVIAAVEVIPLWTLTTLSIASQRARWRPLGGGLPLESLVSLVFPDYYGIFEIPGQYHLPYNFTFMYVYCGMASVLLFVVAPFLRNFRVLVFCTLTIIAAVWMLGQNTPIYTSIYVHVPEVIRGALYAEYALMAFCFFLAITAALTLDRFRKHRPQALLWCIALLTSYDLIRVGSNKPLNSFPGSYRRPDFEYSVGESVAKELRAYSYVSMPPVRVDYTDNIFWQGMLGAGLLRVYTPSGDNPLALLRPMHVRRLYTTGKPWEQDPPVTHYASPLLRMMNVGLLAGTVPIPTTEMTRAGLQQLDKIGSVYVYQVPHPLPRFFLPSRIRKSSGEPETLSLLGSPSFDPASEAIVEGIPADRNGLATSNVDVNFYTPNRIELTINTDRPGFLATSEPLYPGWVASLNGGREAMLMTNGAFRGMFLGAGHNHVLMEYRPRGLLIGAGVSIGALMFVTGLLILPKLKNVR